MPYLETEFNFLSDMGLGFSTFQMQFVWVFLQNSKMYGSSVVRIKTFEITVLGEFSSHFYKYESKVFLTEM